MLGFVPSLAIHLSKTQAARRGVRSVCLNFFSLSTSFFTPRNFFSQFPSGTFPGARCVLLLETHTLRQLFFSSFAIFFRASQKRAFPKPAFHAVSASTQNRTLSSTFFFNPRFFHTEKTTSPSARNALSSPLHTHCQEKNRSFA